MGLIIVGGDGVRARTGIRNILLRSLKNTPYREPAVAKAAIGRIDTRRSEVQEVHIGGVIATRRRPVGAVAALTRGRTTAEVASESEGSTAVRNTCTHFGISVVRSISVEGGKFATSVAGWESPT